MANVITNYQLLTSLGNRIFYNVASNQVGRDICEFLNDRGTYLQIEKQITVGQPPISVVLPTCNSILLNHGISLNRFYSIFISRVITVLVEANGYHKQVSLQGKDIKGLVDQLGVKRSQLFV